jgi:hypothetical protein
MAEYVFEITLFVIGIATGTIRFTTTGTTRFAAIVVAVVAAVAATVAPWITMFAVSFIIVVIMNKTRCSSNKKHDHNNNKQNWFA